jgi:hypothetical protein
MTHPRFKVQNRSAGMAMIYKEKTQVTSNHKPGQCQLTLTRRSGTWVDWVIHNGSKRVVCPCRIILKFKERHHVLIPFNRIPITAAFANAKTPNNNSISTTKSFPQALYQSYHPEPCVAQDSPAHGPPCPTLIPPKHVLVSLWWY